MERVRVRQWSEIDPNTRLTIEKSEFGEGRIVLGTIAPVNTGFGDRLHVPVELSEAADIGGFVELTREQAIDAYERLGRVLAEPGVSADGS